MVQWYGIVILIFSAQAHLLHRYCNIHSQTKTAHYIYSRQGINTILIEFTFSMNQGI